MESIIQGAGERGCLRTPVSQGEEITGKRRGAALHWGALCQPTQSRGGRSFKPVRFGILASFYCALFQKDGTTPESLCPANDSVPCDPCRPHAPGHEAGHGARASRVSTARRECLLIRLPEPAARLLGCSISAAWEARMQPSSRPFLRRAFRRRLRAAG